MRRNAFTLVELGVVVAILLILAAVLFPMFGRGEPSGRSSTCQVNLKQIGLGFQQYLQDSNNRFPSLDTPAGWRVGVFPYLKDDAIFQCPVEENSALKTSDYWFNARLSAISEEGVDSAGLTIIMGDGYQSADPRVAVSQLPKSWIADPKSPAYRHVDGLNFAFVDGHVKWLRPNRVTTRKPGENVNTFAVRD